MRFSTRKLFEHLLARTHEGKRDAYTPFNIDSTDETEYMVGKGSISFRTPSPLRPPIFGSNPGATQLAKMTNV
jgi:hypothetical protein